MTEAVIEAPASTATPDAGAPTTAPTAPPAAPTEAAAPAPNPAEPEAVKYEFKAPEGVTLDDARLERFTALAKDLKLPADKAQALVDLATEVEVQRAEQHETLKAQWADEVRADKELGGDKLDATLAQARKVYALLPEAQATELKGLLDQSGFGNHPAVVRLFAKVGQALSDDAFIPGGKAPAGAERSLAERLYPSKT